MVDPVGWVNFRAQSGSLFRRNLHREAEKDLDRLRGPLWERIRDVILGLRAAPRPKGSVKLVGVEDAYRMRVGDYRIVYEVNDVERVVIIRRVRHRREAYRRL